jgi:hypothetical protein
VAALEATIDGVDEPVPELAEQPAPQSPGPQRTPAGDGLIHGSVLAAWTSLAAVIGHAAGLAGGADRFWWTLGVLAVAAVLIPLARYGHGQNMVADWWTAFGALWAAWLAWTIWADLRSPAPWLALGAGWILACATYPLAHKHRDAARLAARRSETWERSRREEVRWARLLERTGMPGVEVLGKEDTRNGFALMLRLPASGKVTFSKLTGEAEKLETAADVRHGSLRFEKGDTARQVILYVSTRDVLAETLPYVDDGQPMSIRNPIPVGRYEDGRICYLTLREVCVLIIGLRGSGKSGLLNLLIAQLARCVDCLILLNDTKHRLAMEWVRPYLASPPDQWPPIMPVEWVATSRDETEKMLDAVLRGIRARAAAGSGGEKIEPSPGEPAIIMIADEIASIFGDGRGPRYSTEGTTNATLAGVASEAVQIGRSEAHDFVFASQRGTVTMVGSGDMKSQFSIRIGLRVVSREDASLVIPDDQQAQKILASLRHPGSAVLLEDRDARIAPVKFFRIETRQIAEIARRYGPQKPDPEKVLRDAWGPDYETRWDRFRATHNVPAPQAPPLRTGAPAAPDDDSEFQEIVGHLGDLEDAAGDSATRGRQLMREFVARSGERGATVSMIADRLRAGHIPAHERTIRRWLQDDLDNGIIERVSHLLWRMRRPA